MTAENIKKYQQFLDDERNSTALYQSLAENEKDPRLAEIYRRMAAVEVKHADHWISMLKEAGQPISEFKPSSHTKLLSWLGKRFGANMVIPSIQAMEQDGTSGYQNFAEGKFMAKDERQHASLLNQINKLSPGGMTGSSLALLEGRHRGSGGNALRAAVLGANDGMVSNLSLVMGVAGASLANSSILITGLAGLLAGAISMGLGEWLSVQSSRELYTNQIKIETGEIEAAPELEIEELSLIYEARGLKPDQAKLLASQIMENKSSAVETMAREELGIDPDELGGSAWEAAITSFLLFSVGAIVPVIPFTFLSGMNAVLLSIAFSVIGLFILGAATTLFTGKKLLYSGMRMVIFGLLAAAVTFGIGSLIGGNLGG
ncbi:MAG: rubrerythrin family protein [Anaerolineaceae bacterium]|nr:rubrerythrin family protein [Anaerolineaceae bacterium]